MPIRPSSYQSDNKFDAGYYQSDNKIEACSYQFDTSNIYITYI